MAVRLKDVADAAGVSVALVSNYVNGKSTARMSDETRDRIDLALRELNYRPNLVARFLRTGQSRSIGLITAGLAHETHQNLMLLIHEALIRRNWNMLAYYTKNEVGLLRLGWQEMVRSCCAGVITDGQSWQFEAVPLPRVIITNRECSARCPRIVSDHRTGMEAALDHLFALGHRNILFIGDPVSAARRDAPRLQPFLERFPADCVEQVSHPGAIPPEEAGALLARHPDATAALCFNDMIALAFREALMHLGLRVPEDFSLVGFDNIRAAELIGLSTVDMDNPVRAESAVNAVLNIIEKRSDPVRETVPARFVERSSCSAPGKAGWGKKKR